MSELSAGEIESLFADRLNEAAVRVGAAIKTMRQKGVTSLPLNEKQANAALDLLLKHFIPYELERKLELDIEGRLRHRMKPRKPPSQKKR